MRNLRPRSLSWEMAELGFGQRGSELGSHHAAFFRVWILRRVEILSLVCLILRFPTLAGWKVGWLTGQNNTHGLVHVRVPWDLSLSVFFFKGIIYLF